MNRASSRDNDWLTTSTTTTWAELELLANNLPFIEYHGCDDRYHYFRVDNHGYFRIPLSEPLPRIPSAPDAQALPVGSSFLFVRVRQGRIEIPDHDEVMETLEPSPGRNQWNLLILAALTLVVWLFWRRSCSIQIVVDQNGVRSHRGITKAQQQKVLTFFRDDVKFTGKVTIGVSRERNGHLRTHFTGSLDNGTQQRIRNFLISIL